VAKVIIVDGDLILFLLRKACEKHGGKWDLPGGHIVEGESWEQGAIRETAEETNLQIDNLEEVWRHKNKRFFKTSSWEGNIFGREELPEHEDYKWIPAAQIDQLSNISDMYIDAVRRAIR
jgi:8-oxo-dGTP pyrophosphatase MutT (NUDIX family)